MRYCVRETEMLQYCYRGQRALPAPQMEPCYAILQNAEGEIVETYTFDDLEACDDFVADQNDKLAERGLPGFWFTSEGR